MEFYHYWAFSCVMCLFAVINAAIFDFHLLYQDSNHSFADVTSQNHKTSGILLIKLCHAKNAAIAILVNLDVTQCAYINF